jgi:hypothetical protein
MGLFGDDETLMGLIGAADNFGEAMPQINKRETIWGLCIAFTVRAGSQSDGVVCTNDRCAGSVVGMCGGQIVCATPCDSGSWVG